MRTAIIFANRKTTVRDLAQSLSKDGFRAGEIHGDMDQSSRIRELDRFKSGDINILVASDVAARGLDIKGVSHVINYDAPWHPDDYVHRIGRTGRAGATGKAFTLFTEEDAENIANIEKLTKQTIPRIGQPKRETAAPDQTAESDTETVENARAPRRRGPERPKPDRPKSDRAKSGRSDRDRRDAPVARTASAPAQAEANEPIAADADASWNGPVPAFLAARIVE